MGKKKLTIGGKKMQVYLALYGVVDGEHRFLICKKNCCARFYNHKKLPEPKPIPVNHGPKSWVFPGGYSDGIDNSLNEACREFEEETGVKKEEILTTGEIDTISDEANYIVHFVYCLNLEIIARTIEHNLGNIDKVKDDELYTAMLATADQASHLFKSSGWVSSWFYDALTEYNRFLLLEKN